MTDYCRRAGDDDPPISDEERSLMPNHDGFQEKIDLLVNDDRPGDLFLSAEDYESYLADCIHAVDQNIDKIYIKEQFEEWGRAYMLYRLMERAIYLLKQLSNLPHYIYLDNMESLRQLSILGRLYPFVRSPFLKGILVEDSLLKAVGVKTFNPFPVFAQSSLPATNTAVIFSLSGTLPAGDHAHYFRNDYLQNYIDVSALKPVVRARDGFRGHAVVLYVDYKNVKTLSTIAGQVSKNAISGFKTMALISKTSAPSAGYDAVIREPYYLWPLILKIVNPEIFHINVGWGTQGIPFIPFIPDRKRAVIDFYDVLTFISDAALINGHPERLSLTRSSERFLFGNFHHIIHRCCDTINPKLKEKHGTDANIISIFEYLRDPVYSSSVSVPHMIRVAYGGDVVANTSPEDPRYEWTVGLMKCFSRGNLHLYVYPNPMITNFQKCKAIDELIQTLKLSNVHSCTSLEEDAYVEAISEHDYGIIGLTPQNIRPQEYGYGPPFKFISYIRAGLPVVVPEDFTMIAQLVHENSIGVVYSYEDLDRMPELLSSQDLQQLKANVIRFRESLRSEKGAEKVMGLYAAILAGTASDTAAGCVVHDAVNPTSLLNLQA